jgi:hypothetical protein
MMEYTSNIMGFDWEREGGHEGCQMGQVFRGAGKKEKKRDTECFGDLPGRYRYANCSLGHFGEGDSANSERVPRKPLEGGGLG